MDDRLRKAEREFAAIGDYESWRRLQVELARAGYDVESELLAPLSEVEEFQVDYDELWWHAKRGLRCGLWGSNGSHSFEDVDFAPSVYKAHHKWGHTWQGKENSKRKTLRTHRDGSRKNYKIKNAKSEPAVEESTRARRRKKRYGGREHRCDLRWVYNHLTERWTIVYRFGVPNLDE